MTLTFWHIFCFLQVYILANTSLKLIFSVNAIKFGKIFHIFLHLQNMEEFFLVFFGLLRKHKLYRVDFACARSISFSATTKSFRENWCIALLTSIIWQNNLYRAGFAKYLLNFLFRFYEKNGKWNIFVKLMHLTIDLITLTIFSVYRVAFAQYLLNFLSCFHENIFCEIVEQGLHSSSQILAQFPFPI